MPGAACWRTPAEEATEMSIDELTLEELREARPTW